MKTLNLEFVSLKKLEDLKGLSADGPCLTVYMTLSAEAGGQNASEKRNELRWKECVGSVQARADQFGTDGRELISSVEDWSLIRDAIENHTTRGKSIAVFRAPNVFRITVLYDAVPDRAVLGPHFFVRPLLSELVRSRAFYLLALSEKNTRLLHCTWDASEEIPLPSAVQTDFEQWLNRAKPDHTAVNNAMTSGSQGQSGPHALAPKGSDREKKNEYLSHFFKQIDRGVNEILKGKTEPLVLCGVEYEIPLYRDINHYPHLAADEARGAPNSLKSGEMHARAIEALERCYEKKVEETLADWNHRVGGGASSRLKEVVTASYEGRVLTLLISDSQEKIGVYDEARHIVKARETGNAADEEIVNEAAVQTILHAGNVLVVPHHKMPNGSAVAAIYRY